MIGTYAPVSTAVRRPGFEALCAYLRRGDTSMTRSQGRHHFSRRAKLTAGVAGLALTAGLAVAISTTGDQGTAQADGANANAKRTQTAADSRCFAEIARMMGARQGTVRVMVFRALGKLRRELSSGRMSDQVAI